MGRLDTIFDIWLTLTPYGGTSTVKYELEIVPQTDWQYSPLTYTLTDSTLDNAAVYVDPGKIIVVPSSEMLTGTISISDILKSLIWNGVITGQEYISGIEFGPEPGSGSGSLLVNSLNYQWTGTSTVQLTAGNDTFNITTPGGNDVVGDGGSDTVIYSGLYSQFQIKTSGSETLVTENNNISTLDYLQGITFIQFSDGRYNTVTSTFAPATVIQVDGSTSLTEIGNNYFLFDSGGSGPALKYQGADVVAGQFGGFEPIGAVQTASGYDVAWEVPGANEYSVWSTDSNGNYISSDGVVSGTSYALESLEPIFHQDLNGDGVVGLTTTVIQTDGSTSLTEVANQYYLNGSGGSGPALKYQGADVVAGQFGGFEPIGAVQTASGYDVAWEVPGANEYSVWSTDSNGNYISSDGVVSGTSYALESLEPIFHQDLNGDGVVGLTTTVIQTDGSTSLTEVANQYYLNGSGGSGPALKYQGADVVAGQFGGFEPIGAVQTASGYDVAWEVPGANEYSVWSTDSNGNYISSDGVVSGTSYALESLEPIFHQDLNGDGVVGLTTTVIQTDGSTSLTEVANQYYLNGSGGSGPALKYQGADVVAGQFGGFEPIGAVQTASGYDVAWEVPGANEYSVWSTDSNGNYISSDGVVSGTSYALESLEPIFHQDLNGDGVVGLTTTVIQTDGSTSLTEVANQYYLNGSGGSGPALKYQGADVVAGQFGGFEPIGAVQTASGYDVAWEVPGANEYSVWSTDSNGNYISSDGVVSGTSYALESLEPIFHQDLNGDGVVGLTTTVIQTDGSTSLTEVANQYYLNGSGGSGPALKYQGADVVAGQFGGFEPIGAVQTASGYDVAWEVPGANEYSVWSTDSNGNYISSDGVVSGTSYALESLEPIFHQDLNGDGVVGPYAAPGSTMQIDSALSEPVTIGSGATLELGVADSASVTFNSSTGMLQLDHSSTFSGDIFKFTGNGNLSGSDQIDLRDINYNSVQDSYANGVLTVTDGIDTANIDFNGSYTLANFKFASDGNGGTIVYDPPVSDSAAPSATPQPTSGPSGNNIVASTPKATLVGDDAKDTFIFPPNFGQAAIDNYVAGKDTIQFDHATFATADGALAAAHDDGHGAVVMADAAHDALTLHNTTAAQLHHSHLLIV